ncbi:DUF420 domain-containing protein [Labilithrix luteola]|uniref:DUF420 domain-containing protein n=1 Tax=Labilithrix luteola TaxID=1391654 RepID=UPI001472A9F8|nr:DUF420 domain-containing protein [Labilithrix luteola]
MLGSRADLVVDLTLLTNLSAPLVAAASFRLVRRRRADIHRRMQLALLAVCTLAVVALEVRIRMSGGSGAFLSHGPTAWARTTRAFLGVHITVAVLTYAVWARLAFRSSSRYGKALPGSFSTTHRRTGWLVFAGLCFNAVSACAMYVLAFVA